MGIATPTAAAQQLLSGLHPLERLVVPQALVEELPALEARLVVVCPLDVLGRLEWLDGRLGRSVDLEDARLIRRPGQGEKYG